MNITHDETNARGSAGGAASTGGAVYAGSVGAWCAVQLLLGRGAALPWKLSDEHSITSMACENATHVDDLVLHLLPHGTVYIQIKHGLMIGPEFDKAMAQLVRQFWSSDFSFTKDRLVIATDPSASGTVRTAARNVLSACHDLAADADIASSITSNATKTAFLRFQSCFESVSAELKKSPDDIANRFRDFLGCTHITLFDTMGGLQENSAIESLHNVVNPDQATHAWILLSATCLKVATLRNAVDRPALWDILQRHQIDVSLRRLSLKEGQVQLKDILKGMTEQRIYQLTALGQFVSDQYVPRKNLDDHLRRFCTSTKSLMLISGGSGQGKTSWCAQRGKLATDRPVLLVAAENLEGSDGSLNATLKRLINQYIREHGGHPPSAVELNQWLNHARLLIIIDGLDRAPSFNKHLSQWMDASLAQLTQSKLKLVLTGRPETMGRLKASVERSRRAYRPQVGAGWQVPLSDFTEEEAIIAAGKLGDPGLAQYRRPGMMSYCAQILERGDTVLEETQIMDLYIEHRISQVTNEYDILHEHLERFIDRLSQVLASSRQGVLARNEVLDMHGFDKLAYDALRRVNFIAEAQGVLRVEPDKLSERLHGRFLDVAQTITELERLESFPLKMGALRFALIDLARRNTGQAIKELERLVELSENQQIDIARSLACSLFEVLPDWSSLEPLATALGESYHASNIFQFLDSCNALLKLMTSKRWSAKQRVRLLWTLAKTESGIDWRQKHWEKRYQVSHFHVTAWREHMLSALQDPQAEAWESLIERFDSSDAFEDTDEANLGHLAQGLFFLCAETRIWPALQALAYSASGTSLKLLELLARDYSEQVAPLVEDILSSGLFGFKHKQSLAWGLQANSPTSAIIKAMRSLMADSDDSELRATCLRVFGRSGDAVAVLDLINAEHVHEVDVAVCLRYPHLQFQAFSMRIFERVMQREVDSSVLGGFRSGGESPDQTLAHFKFLNPFLMQVLEQLPESGITISSIFEHYIVVAIDHTAKWPGLYESAEKILYSANDRARKMMVYASTGTHTREPSMEGRLLRARIIESLIEHETDERNLQLFQEKLMSAQIDNPDAPNWLAKMMSKHPGVPSRRALLLARIGGVNEQKIEQVLNSARSLIPLHR